MKTGRRGFLKGIFGATAGAAAISVPGVALALTEKQKVEVKRKIQGMTKDEIIELLLSNTPLYLGNSFEDTPMDVPAKISPARRKRLKEHLKMLNRLELIAHAEEFYGITITNPKLGE